MDSFISENDLIIIYEWAAAGDLKRQLRKAQEKGVGFEERVIWKYFSQICLAIQHMHEKRIMHRDLKPANIFLTLDGTIKVGDLGLSRELSEHTIQAHSKVGTPLYMSPEVLKGDGYDFKSDIWSLGCLLYELAMLKSPFKAEGLNLYSLFQKISNGEYQPLPDTYSEELRTLAAQMISIKSEERPDINYICQIAQRMRQQTQAERGSKNRGSFNISGDDRTKTPDSRPGTNGDIRMGEAQAAATAVFSEIHKKDDRRNPRQNSEDKPAPVSEYEFKGIANMTKINEEKEQNIDNRDNAENLEGKAEAKVNIEKNSIALEDYFSYKNTVEQKGATQLTGVNEPPFHAQSTAKNYQSRDQADTSKGAVRNASDINSYIDSRNDTPTTLPSGPTSNQTMYKRSKPPDISASGKKSSWTKNDFPNRPQPDNLPSSTATSRPSSVDVNENARDNNDKVHVPNEEIQNSAQALALMDNVYSKLQLLQYPMNDPEVSEEYLANDSRGRGKLLPIHFACSLQSFGNIAGHEKYNGHMKQFSRMVHVVRWLCEKIGGEPARAMKSADGEFASSITIAKQILLAAQVINVL